MKFPRLFRIPRGHEGSGAMEPGVHYI